MRHTRPVRERSLALFVVTLAPAVTSLELRAAADDTPPAPVSLEEMARRLDELEKRNQSLEGEVRTLREADGEQWLSDERASQIRAIVQDTLADAETRASLQSTGMTAGWDDGFFLMSADGRFKLEVGGLLQVRWAYNTVRTTPPQIGASFLNWNDGAEERWGFELPNTRLWFQGHLFSPALTYKIMGQFNNDLNTYIAANQVRPQEGGSGIFQLEDAWGRFEVLPGWFIRAGQFRLPFSREELIEPQYQLAVNRSLPSYSLGVGYSQGVEFAYVSDLFRAQIAYSDGANDQVGSQMKYSGGVLPQNVPYLRGRTLYAFTGRVEFKPFGSWDQFNEFTSPPGSEFGLLFGLGAHWQVTDPDYQTQNVNNATDQTNEWIMVTADASANFGGASLFGSFTWANVESQAAYLYGSNGFNLPPFGDLGAPNAWGMVLQGAVYVAPKVELFARWELGQLTTDPVVFSGLNPTVYSFYAFENHLNIVTAGVNWYIDGQDAKLSADFGYALDSVDPSWYFPQTNWRESPTRDEWVFRTQFQLMF